MATEDGKPETWSGPRYFTVDEVNGHIPRLTSLFGTIMGLRTQLKAIFQRLDAVGHAPEEPAPALGAMLGQDDGEDEDDDEDGEDGDDEDADDEDEDEDDDEEEEEDEDTAIEGQGELPADVARDRLVFHGMAETLRDFVEEVLATGCVIKDIEIGLVDWLGRHDDRDIWLCWKYGEREVGFWHDHGTGFSGRRPVTELRPPRHAP